MHPIVVSSTFERLTRERRSAFLLLLETIFLSGLLDEFFFQSLFLSLSVGFLLVGDLRWFVEIRLIGSLGTQNALVVVGHALLLVVLASVTKPFA